MLHLELLIIYTNIVPNMRSEIIGQWFITGINLMQICLGNDPIIRTFKTLMLYQ